MRRDIALIGAPIDLGTHERGPAIGPAFLRAAGLSEALARLGLTVEDRGDVAPPPTGDRASQVADAQVVDAQVVNAQVVNARNLSAIAAWSRALADQVQAALDDGRLPIVLGGDHSLSIGSIDGVARHCRAQDRELFVLWLDAHADINTPETSPTGNMHGMPLAALCGEAGFGDAFSARPLTVIEPKNLFLFGIRSVDPGERALIRARRLDVVDMRRIDEEGVVAPLRRILDHVAARRGFLHVSFDVDFLDPAVAPGVGTTVPGGATYREAHLVMEMLHESGLVASLDLVEMNPFLDMRGQSALTLVELIASLFGRTTIDRAATRAFRQEGKGEAPAPFDGARRPDSLFRREAISGSFPIMTIALTPEQQAWIDAHVARGAYPSVEEAARSLIDAAITDLGMLEDDDLAWAKPLVDPALAEVERGEVMTLEEHRARNRARLAAMRE